MKTLKIIILLIIIQVTLNAQVKRVAILDFENNSGNTSYDYLGKALSNMLITDLSNNIHPKNAIFIERNQLNKIINEQKLQNTSKFNQSTTVKIGKLFGSDYIFLGNVFVMNENCTFSARLVSTEQGKVLFSKEITGPINNFLILKTQLANLIAEELNYPIKINNEHNKNISSTLLKQYGAILTKIDEGKAEEAEKLRSALEETSPEFSYFSDLKEDLKKIISKVNELEDVVNNTTDFYKKGMESYNNKNYEKSIQILDALEKNNDDSEPYFYNRKMISYAVKAKIYYDKKDFIKRLR
jgi:TolB-like protein